ncbi:MAG: hypothetical protein HC793_04560 [Aquincola sp.]|nr:hypothetical protein [Aquincola sp.]
MSFLLSWYADQDANGHIRQAAKRCAFWVCSSSAGLLSLGTLGWEKSHGGCE